MTLINPTGDGKAVPMVSRMLTVGAALLLSGCLEAIDLAEERIVSPPYCETPNGIALCKSEIGDSDEAFGAGSAKP